MKFPFYVLALIVATAFTPLSASGQNLFRTNRPSYTKTPYYNYSSSSSWQRPAVAEQYSRSIGRLPAGTRTLPPFTTAQPMTQPTAQSTTLPPVLPPTFAANQSPYVASSPPRYEPLAPTPRNANADYQRIVAAWQNYQSEMLRYQQLYGNADAISGIRPSTVAAPLVNSADNHACRSRQFAPRYDGTPRYDVAPLGYYENDPSPNLNRQASPGSVPADQRPSLLPSAPTSEQRYYRESQNIGDSSQRRSLEPVPYPSSVTPWQRTSSPARNVRSVHSVLEPTRIDDPRTTASVTVPPSALALSQ